MIFVHVFLGIVAVLTSLLFVRSELVYAYRLDLLGRIDRVNQVEINGGVFNVWMLRHEWLHAVDHHQMVSRFWRPLDSFYPDREKWLKPGDPTA